MTKALLVQKEGVRAELNYSRVFWFYHQKTIRVYFFFLSHPPPFFLINQDKKHLKISTLFTDYPPGARREERDGCESACVTLPTFRY